MVNQLLAQYWWIILLLIVAKVDQNVLAQYKHKYD